MEEREWEERKRREIALIKKIGKWVGIVFAAIICITVLNPFVIVPAGNRGVVTNFGAVSKTVMQEGLGFRMPIYQRVHLMDVRIVKAETPCDSVSRDLQDIKTVVAVNFHVDPSRVNALYQRIGTDFKERIIDPAVQEVVKATTAQFTGVELIQKREDVRVAVKGMLKERLAPYYLTVDDLAIVNFKFSQQFEAAIEAKQTAEQLAQKAERDLQRIKTEAEQKVATAKAEAESLRVQKENVTPQLIELRRVEANIKAIEKWNGVMPVYAGGGALPFLNIGAGNK